MKRASEKDTNTNEVKTIAYNKLHIAPQHHEGTTKNYLFFTLDQREDNGFLNYPLDDIALEDHLQNIIGNQKAQKIIKIEDVKDSNELKKHLISRDKKSLPSKGVRIGGKRKRKTRKSKRPRKSKKSKRKTNRKKI